jgi:hypothetical protein
MTIADAGMLEVAQDELELEGEVPLELARILLCSQAGGAWFGCTRKQRSVAWSKTWTQTTAVSRSRSTSAAESKAGEPTQSWSETGVGISWRTLAESETWP